MMFMSISIKVISESAQWLYHSALSIRSKSRRKTKSNNKNLSLFQQNLHLIKLNKSDIAESFKLFWEL